MQDGCFRSLSCAMRSAHRMPVASAYGMSVSGQSWLRTPFWPCRELNLSPMTGLRLMRVLTDACDGSRSRGWPISVT